MPAKTKLKVRKRKIYHNEEMEDRPFPEPSSYKLLVEKPESLGDINESEGAKLSGSLIQIFFQATAPASGMNTGDWWKDSDDNKIYRYSGAAWGEKQDDDIAIVIASAATAQATADGRIYVFRQDDAPVDADTPDPPGVLTTGDVWFDSNDDEKSYRWSGSAWVAVAFDVADWAKIFGADKPDDNATEGADWLSNLININLVERTAGEDVVQGKAASVVGHLSIQSDAAHSPQDAYVDEANPGDVFDGNWVDIWNEAGNAGARKRGFYKWNLTDLPVPSDEPQKEIISVALHFYCQANGVGLKIKKVTVTEPDWSEDALTWNNQPATEGENFWAGLPAVGWNEIDITDLYKEDNAGPTRGICFVGTSGAAGVNTRLASHENTGWEPYLVIVYREKVAGKIYMGTSIDGKCADGFIGFFNETKSAAATVKVAIAGIESHQSGLTVNERYYLTDTPGVISTTPGTNGALVGKAVDTTKLLIYNNFMNAEAIKETKIYLISDDIYKANDVEVSTSSVTMIEKKKLTMPPDFPDKTIRVQFKLQAFNGALVNGRIYKNDSPLGTNRSTANVVYQTYTEDLIYQKGDKLQLYLNCPTGLTAKAKELRILGTTVISGQKYTIV